MRKGLTKDLSVITNVPHATMESLFAKIPMLITHSIYEAMVAEEEETTIDVGFGSLVTSITDDEVRMRFVPCRKLEQMIQETIETKTDPMIATLEENLKEKIESAYKNLC